MAFKTDFDVERDRPAEVSIKTEDTDVNIFVDGVFVAYFNSYDRELSRISLTEAERSKLSSYFDFDIDGKVVTNG